MHMDLGEGREFDMLQSVLLSDRLNLIDHLFVQWHYQAEVMLCCSLLMLSNTQVPNLP